MPRKKIKLVQVDFTAVLPMEVLWQIMDALPMSSLWCLRNVSSTLRIAVTEYVRYYVQGLNFNDIWWLHIQARHCVVHKRIDGLKCWLDFGAKADNALLKLAVERNYIVGAETLLKAGAVPENDIVVITVREQGRAAMLGLLLKHGADAQYYRLLDMAVRLNKVKVAEMLIAHGAMVESAFVHSSVCSNKYPMVNLLLKHAPNVWDDEIMYAVMWSSCRILQALLDRGENNATWDWANALHHAAVLDRHRHAKLLLTHGADVNTRDSMAFRMAVVRGNIKTMRVFIEHGVDVNACDGEALLTAVRSNYLEEAKLLLASGANVPPFIQRAYKVCAKPSDMARLLIEYGAVRRSPRLA